MMRWNSNALQRVAVVTVLISGSISCGLKPTLLYPGPPLSSSDVATFGASDIPGKDGGVPGRIIESIDGIILCRGEFNCPWQVETLPGEHILRLRWSELPQPVTVGNITYSAYVKDYRNFTCDLLFDAQAGKTYRATVQEASRTPVLLSGVNTAIFHWRAKIFEVSALGIFSDQGPLRELCSIESDRIVDGKCPPCIQTE